MVEQNVECLGKFMSGLRPDGPPSVRFLRRAPNAIYTPGKSIGVLDASFNPMTLAHQQMIKAAREASNLSEILLMLSRTNVDKEVFGADLGHRLSMLIAFAEDWDDVSVAGCSHARFVDKTTALLGLLPTDTEISFILGYDTLRRLFDPKYYDDMGRDLNRLFEGAKVVAANRGEAGANTVRGLLNKADCRKFKHRVDIIHLEPPYSKMSSTEVRGRKMRGESIRDWVPKRIEDKIETMGLYNE